MNARPPQPFEKDPRSVYWEDPSPIWPWSLEFSMKRYDQVLPGQIPEEQRLVVGALMRRVHRRIRESRGFNDENHYVNYLRCSVFLDKRKKLVKRNLEIQKRIDLSKAELSFPEAFVRDAEKWEEADAAPSEERVRRTTDEEIRNALAMFFFNELNRDHRQLTRLLLHVAQVRARTLMTYAEILCEAQKADPADPLWAETTVEALRQDWSRGVRRFVDDWNSRAAPGEHLEPKDVAESLKICALKRPRRPS